MRDKIVWLLSVARQVGTVLAWVGLGLWVLHAAFTVGKGG